MDMGSADSAGNNGTNHSGVSSSSCGLVVGSLFPNSCRGRAESFARRLHRRLTSLGSEVGSSSGNAITTDDEEQEAINVTSGTNKLPTEKSWLHGSSISTDQRNLIGASNKSSTSLSCGYIPNYERVLDSQPRHSPESDIFYDFDIDPNDQENVANSPAEMADDTHLLNNLEINERMNNRPDPDDPTQNEMETATRPQEMIVIQDPESGCVFSSPLASTSPDTEDTYDVFFDPLSSETEKTCSSSFPPDNSQQENKEMFNAEITDNADDDTIGKVSAPLRRRIRRDIDSSMVNRHHQEDRWRSEDTSESSSASSNNLATDRVPPSMMKKPLNRNGSSEESLDGNKSSLETTSASHESLWSTFDDSTVSLQDEACSCTVSNSVNRILENSTCSTLKKTLPKSHSDTEIIGSSGIRVSAMTNGDKNDEDNDETTNDNDCQTYSSSIEIPGSLVLECPTGRRVNESLGLNDEDDSPKDENDANESERGMSRLLERLARSPNIGKDAESVIKDTEVTNGKDENDEDNDGTAELENEDEEQDEEEEEGDEKPQRVRRCSSLKTGKTPPGTPGRKKIVRFADVLGLDLADVRTFLDEIPKVPNSAYSDLIYDNAFQKDSSPVNFWGTGPATFTTPLYAATMPNSVKLDRSLVPLFQQPGGSANFLDLVRERQVCLENVIVQDPINMCLQGTVRVRNLDFHKSVHARYTLDSWRSFSDLQAVYAPNSCDGFSDKFTFLLYCHTLKIGQRLEIAVRFQCKGAQYWDNNGGANYCFQCLPAATSNNHGYIPITVPSPMIITPPCSQITNNHSRRDWSPTFY